MGMMAAATVLATAVSGGFQALSAQDQKEAAKAGQTKVAKAEYEAQRKADRISAETMPEQKVATGVEFGQEDTELGSYNDFVQPLLNTTKSSGLSGSGLSGLGFK